MAVSILDTIYQGVPAEARERFSRFRMSHPYTTLAVDGVNWEYIAAGSGKDAVLVLGGGLSTGESSFGSIQRLEGTFRVISPSYPLTGNLEAIADGLAAILDAEGIRKAHVFGHSLGAGIAHAFVRRHPDRVDKLILSGFGLYLPATLRKVRFFLRISSLLPYGFLRRVYMKKFKRLLAKADNAEARFMLAYAAELLFVQHTKTSVLGQLDLLWDLFDRYEAIHTYEPVARPGQVLIIAAKDDKRFKPVEQERLWATYPGAQIHQFESGGHLAGWTRRDEYNAILDNFLGSKTETEQVENTAVPA
jgi:pimeloyl-ACP methyl ester carboxylesterase